jgi:hypothetical protein
VDERRAGTHAPELREEDAMTYAEAWVGREVETAAGDVGVIVSRSRGTAYVRLGGGDFRRILVADLEPVKRDESPPLGRKRPRVAARGERLVGASQTHAERDSATA